MCEIPGKIPSTTGRKEKNGKRCQAWWLQPVILVTWEVEVRRIMVIG
jgi:hypothetical protein